MPLSTFLQSIGLESLRQRLEEEELTVDLLLSMGRHLHTNLEEIGISKTEAETIYRALRNTDPVASPATQQLELPTSVREDQLKQPMVILVDHGLCNRLRAVLSYRQIAQSQALQLLVVWCRDDQCNGEFLDCFAPLPGVRFTRQLPHWAPAPERINHCHVAIKDTPAETESYAALLPCSSLRAAIDARVRECTPFVAVHIRRTDMSVLATTQPNGRYSVETTDAAFDAFLEEFPHYNVYIATDCGHTQARFSKRYERRMKATVRPRYERRRWRQTTLMDAVIDLYMCAASEHFMGSYGSSFSDTIIHLRSVHGQASQLDRHTFATVQDWGIQLGGRAALHHPHNQP